LIYDEATSKEEKGGVQKGGWLKKKSTNKDGSPSEPPKPKKAAKNFKVENEKTGKNNRVKSRGGPRDVVSFGETTREDTIPPGESPPKPGGHRVEKHMPLTAVTTGGH